MLLISIFNDYYYWRKELESYSFYDYIKVIFYVKYNTRQWDNIPFDSHHLNPLSKIQQPSNTPECNILVVFIWPLSTNKNIENSINWGHFETDAKQNDVALILLAFMIPWNRLIKKFYLHKALWDTYLDYYWNIWEDFVKNLKKYMLYATKNILQIRKTL